MHPASQRSQPTKPATQHSWPAQHSQQTQQSSQHSQLSTASSAQPVSTANQHSQLASQQKVCQGSKQTWELGETQGIINKFSKIMKYSSKLNRCVGKLNERIQNSLRCLAKSIQSCTKPKNTNTHTHMHAYVKHGSQHDDVGLSRHIGVS